MSEFERIVAVTNRHLLGENEDFMTRLAFLADLNPKGILLREKDLPEDEYESLAMKAMKLCSEKKVLCILHCFPKVAEKLGVSSLHLPLHTLRNLPQEKRQKFKNLGASCHSLEDAREAIRLGATYIVAGHIYDTNSKPGLSGRGLDFLRSVAKESTVPVYAIGGITLARLPEVLNAGAKGAFIMSGI